MNSNWFRIREMTVEDVDRVCEFIRDVFDKFVAPHYSQEGIEGFYKYVDPGLMAGRIHNNHAAWLSESEGRIVGMIEVRELNHVSLLFVTGEMQRKGIGRQLLSHALEWCRRGGFTHEVTVHSTPNSVSAYGRYGFQVEGPEQNIHGIRFVPMKLGL